jgi:nucleoside-diphosphate-sugar epimerase
VAALTLPGGGFAVGHYIYISTDSVYQATPLPQDHNRALTEDCCAPPTNEAERLAIVEASSRHHTGKYQLKYGGNKLGCDIALQAAFKASKFPFTSLRLPDVYGPFDNLGR